MGARPWSGGSYCATFTDRWRGSPTVRPLKMQRHTSVQPSAGRTRAERRSPAIHVTVRTRTERQTKAGCATPSPRAAGESRDREKLALDEPANRLPCSPSPTLRAPIDVRRTVATITGSVYEQGFRTVSLYMLAMRGGISIGALLTGATVTLLGRATCPAAEWCFRRAGAGGFGACVASRLVAEDRA
jgi:hypothetical protein